MKEKNSLLLKESQCVANFPKSIETGVSKAYHQFSIEEKLIKYFCLG
ncbi:hypothetical protein [Nostoc sp.]